MYDTCNARVKVPAADEQVVSESTMFGPLACDVHGTIVGRDEHSKMRRWFAEPGRNASSR